MGQTTHRAVIEIGFKNKTPTQCTIVRAAIVVDTVAIITSLMPCLPWGNILPHDAVTTLSCAAIVEAGIGLHLVAIVASFDALRDHTITAAVCRAVVAAAIGIHIIAVIAHLLTIAHHTITAACQHAGV